MTENTKFVEGVGIVGTDDIKAKLYEFAQDFSSFDSMMNALQDEAIEAWNEYVANTQEENELDELEDLRQS